MRERHSTSLTVMEGDQAQREEREALVKRSKAEMVRSDLRSLLRRRTVGRTAVLLMAAAFLLLLVVGLASVMATRDAHRFSQAAAADERTRREADQVMLDAVNAETGQRGYLLIGAPEYLDVHKAAVSRLSAEMATLAAATQGRPAEARAVAHLKILIDATVAELQRTIALRAAGRGAEALAQVRAGRGRLLMGQIRDLLATIDSAERRSHDMTAREAELAARRALAVNLASAVLIAAIGLLSLSLIRRYVMQLKASRAELDRVNQGLERTVAERTSALVRANEEIQRFAYIVSHDLRSPLVNVMGYTSELEAVSSVFARQIERLEREAPGLIDAEVSIAVKEDAPEALGFIRSSTEKMDRLIKAILQLSRDGRRVLSPEPIDMHDELRRVADGLSHQAHERGATISIQPMPGLTSDRLAIQQIFANLLENAIKYLAEGRPGRIAIRGRDEGPMVVYEVEDNGRGVADRDHQRVFELFRRAGVQDQPGEGLGLAFVKSAVRRLGGSIDLSSQLGQGTTFTLRFPRQPPVEARESE